MKRLRGIFKSIRTYYGNRQHLRAMTRHYRAFVEPGDLVFDIGAHVGDRVLAFRRLHCRVVALEPQPHLYRVLKLIHGFSKTVVLLDRAASARAGTLALHVNEANPTVSTASRAFIDASQNAIGWDGQVWNKTIDVEAVTLDSLIERFGVPAFVKIDVEGFEDQVLAGLSQALPALSFEFTTHQKPQALACLDRLRSLGNYRFQACLGESWQPVFARVVDEDTIRHWLAELPQEANSGDIYCILEHRPEKCKRFSDKTMR